MGLAVATMTHHVAQASHITVNSRASSRDLIEIFRRVEPCDLLELSV
jgi:hypothetical protein